MTQNATSTHRLTWLFGTVAVVCGLGSPHGLQAQRPAMSTAALRTASYPGIASPFAAIAAPEPPQNSVGAPITDDLFAGTEKFAKGASDVTEVNMDPNSLSMVNGPDAHRAHNMVLNVVKTYTYEKPGMYNPADLDEFRHKLETGDWHCSVHTRDLKNGDSTDVCNRRRAPDMVESAIITASPKSLTFIHTIRKANGQGGELNFNTSPGLSMVGPGLPSDISAQIARSVATAHQHAMADALRARLPRAEDLSVDLPADMASLGDELKGLREELDARSVQQLRHLQEQLGELRSHRSEMTQDLQHLREQLEVLPQTPPDRP